MAKYDAFEFSRFMEDYLNSHPEVVEDQKRGWDFYWNPRRGTPGEMAAIDGDRPVTDPRKLSGSADS